MNEKDYHQVPTGKGRPPVPASLRETAVPITPFADTFTVMMERCHTISRANGFYDDGEPNHGERIALMHSELSEALEALRKGNPQDDKIPQLSAVEVELADVIIRIMDYAAAQGFCLAEAIEAKCAYNETRSYKHGKAF